MCVCVCVGPYIPSCDEDGFYRPQQCHGSSGQCWCVDRYGNEIAGSRTTALLTVVRGVHHLTPQIFGKKSNK